MIIGIGTDLVEIARVESSLSRYGERFAERILSADEIELWREAPQKAQFLASRFAAKEAASKALGTGIRDGLNFTDIEILKNELNKPYLVLKHRAQEMAQNLNITHSHVTLSHERHYAIAFVVLESNKLDDLI
jgi:holo-[acyl-carrier protein] synthase